MQEKSKMSLGEDYTYFGYECPTTVGEAIALGLELLGEKCHHDSYNRGWYHDPITGKSLIPGDTLMPIVAGEYRAGIEMGEQALINMYFPFVIATKIALIHSEASEMLEALRRNQMDDKIPEFHGIAAEGSDVIIRVMDVCRMLREYHSGIDGMKYNVGEALLSKLPVNDSRLDHALESRRKPGGKLF